MSFTHRPSLLLALSLVAACAAPTGDGNESQEAASETAGAGTITEALHHGSSITDSFDRTGFLRTIDVNGPIDRTNPFFQTLGSNGRRCDTCHVAQDGWTITPEHVQDLFEDTDGTDPLFRTVDGSNSPNAPVATKAQRRKAYSMLLHRAVIRIGIGIPANAEFELVKADDPYGFASAAQLSLFRRPLPSTNLSFLSTVMWDGRESPSGQTINVDLALQSNDATVGHAEAKTLISDAVRKQIVDFETGLFTAQIFDIHAGDLRARGAQGGPQELVNQPFFLGINDPLGLNPTGAKFDPNVFTIYQPWANLPEPHPGHRRGDGCDDDRAEEARESIARGEDLFDNFPIDITGVAGLNDDLNKPHIAGHCTTCHDSPNVGDHSLAAPLNIGLADASRRTPDMPLYTLRNKTTHEIKQTTDPGRALISGKWKDVGRFKGPILRGLAARAPYFHNGFAADLDAVVDFYVQRFDLKLTKQQHQDLVHFLGAL